MKPMPALLVALLWLGLSEGSAGWAETPPPMDKAHASKSLKAKPMDIYLLGDRICRQCTLRWVGPDTVELSDRQGRTGFYPAREITDLETHPVLRRLLYKSIHGVGLPGPILLPQAFEEETKRLPYYGAPLRESP